MPWAQKFQSESRETFGGRTGSFAHVRVNALYVRTLDLTALVVDKILQSGSSCTGLPKALPFKVEQDRICLRHSETADSWPPKRVCAKWFVISWASVDQTMQGMLSGSERSGHYRYAKHREGTAIPGP